MATVLFVGQETHLRYVIRAMLRDLYQVIVVDTFEAVAQILAREPVDLVLCSVSGNGTPRRELLAMAQARGAGRRVPVVAVVEQGHRGGAPGAADDPVVRTPFSSKQLRAVLQAELAMAE